MAINGSEVATQFTSHQRVIKAMRNIFKIIFSLSPKKYFYIVSVLVLSATSTLPVGAVSDFYSDSNIQFYDPNACNPNSESSGGSDANTSTTTGPVYIMGDSITNIADNAYTKKFKDWQPTVKGADSRQIAVGSNPTNGVDQIVQDKDIVKKAKIIVIALGTNSLGEPGNKGWVKKLMQKVNANKQADTKVFWVNVYDKNQLSKSKTTNTAIKDGVGGGAEIIDWYKAARNKATGSFESGVHPTSQHDIQLLVDTVYDSVSNGGTTGTGSTSAGSSGGSSTGIDYDNTQSADTNYEVSVESDGADGSASGDGSYQSGTSYGHNLGWKTHFVALNPGWASKKGVVLGDVVKIVWKGKTVYAIYGDNHAGDSVHTEVSLSVKRAFLGSKASVTTGFGSKSDPVKFTIYPDTHKKIKGNPPSNTLIDKVGAEVSGQAASSSSDDTGSSCVCADGSSGSTVSLDGKDNIEKVFNYFTSATVGLKPFQAAGIIGNMNHESGVEPQKAEGVYDKKVSAEEFTAGTGGPGWGLVQWTPGSKMINPTKAAKKDPNDIKVQLDFLWDQLNGKTTSPEKQAGDDLKSTKTTEEAVRAFQGDNNIGGKYNGYERPGSQSATLADRIATAKSVEKKYGSGGGSSSTSSGGLCSGSSGATASCGVTKPMYDAQYTQAQLKKLFGDPGTATSHPDMDKNLVDVDFNGRKVQVNKKASGCLEAVAAEIKQTGVSYTVKEMGCYRFDSDNGSTNIGLRSYHTYGVACDINPSANPFVSGGTASHDMPEGYIKAFHNHGWTWGGDWNTVKDYMHFEFHGVKP